MEDEGGCGVGLKGGMVGCWLLVRVVDGYWLLAFGIRGSSHRLGHIRRSAVCRIQNKMNEEDLLSPLSRVTP